MPRNKKAPTPAKPSWDAVPVGTAERDGLAEALVHAMLDRMAYDGRDISQEEMKGILKFNCQIRNIPEDHPAVQEAVDRARWAFGHMERERTCGKPAAYVAALHEIWFHALSDIAKTPKGGRTPDLENPAATFKQILDTDPFRALSDREYNDVVDEITLLATHIWKRKPGIPVTDAIAGLVEGACRFEDEGCLRHLAWAMAAMPFAPSDPWGLTPFNCGTEAGEESPADIVKGLDGHVHGQREAKKAAAMVMWHHFRGERSNVVFCGPTGCGKSEIWRVLAHEYPGSVRMVDFSRMTGDGWSGSLHLRDMFEDLDPSAIARNGLVVVLDEADKIFCESAIGSGGTDHNKIVQSAVLKMLDGDVIEFGSDGNRQRAFSIDCRNVSVVVLGAFESMLERKNRASSGLGFGKEVRRNKDYGDVEITHEDLIEAGMRREIAGRMGRIVSLSPLSREDYAQILNKFVVPGMSNGSRAIIVDESFARNLVDQAMESRLGVRWMRSKLAEKLDDLIFENPDRETYRVSD